MRLDQQLVALGLVASRSRARDLIKRGFVRIGGEVCDKASHEVREGAPVSLAEETPQYVSRGAEKLVAALDHFGFDVSGRTALDVGASTGGFTQVLLERGAKLVYAVDVGHAQLSSDLREDRRVRVMEGIDARALDASIIADPIDAIVADVSFISLAKALPAALALSVPGAWLVALVKPQFEVGRDGVGKGGVVRDEAARRGAVAQLSAWLGAQSGWCIAGEIVSPIAGGSGNVEYLIGARRDD